jgi:phospholipid-translocating ATPase
MRSGEVADSSIVTESGLTHVPDLSESTLTLNAASSQARLHKFLDDDPHAYSLSYPPPSTSSTTTLANTAANKLGSRFRSGSLMSAKAMSTRSCRSFGVVDWNKQTKGTAR